MGSSYERPVTRTPGVGADHGEWIRLRRQPPTADGRRCWMMATMAPARPGLDPWLLDLYRTDYRRLVRMAAMLVDDVGTAEEVVQDAFVAIARRFADAGGPDDAGATAAYLRSAVMNGARSALRKRSVRRRHLRSVAPPMAAPAADLGVLADDETRRVVAALGRLSDRQREVLVLRFYAELTEVEIAETLGISPGSVKTHAHRGLAALETHLEATP